MGRLFLTASFLLIGFATLRADLPRDEYLYLYTRFDTDGFAPKGAANEGDFDGAGAAYAEESLPRGRRWVVRSDRYGDVIFLRPQTERGKRNFLTLKGQTIPVQTKERHVVLFSLGAAHHGDASGWVEFVFTDGSTAKAPIGFTDWASSPHLGEEVALATTSVGEATGSSNARSIFLQRTPIPGDKILRAIRLPDLPNARVLALTLATRADFAIPGLPPAPGSATPREVSGPVAIFAEPGLPMLFAPAGLDPEGIRGALSRVGVEASFASAADLEDPSLLDPEKIAVLVLPYGGVFPEKAATTLASYRASGGAVVHLGPAWALPVVRTSYGHWHPAWVGHYATPFEHSPRAAALSSPVAVRAGNSVSGQAPLIEAWGLGSVPWERYRPRPSVLSDGAWALDPATAGDGATVLLADPAGNALALLREDPGNNLGPELCVSTAPLGLEGGVADSALAMELLVRGAAWALHRRGKLDDEAWKKVAESPLADVPGELPTPPEGERAPGLQALLAAPLADATGRRTSPDAALHVVSIAGLSAGEQMLLASLQGLLHRDGRASLLVDTVIGSSRSAEARFGGDPAFSSVVEMSLADAIGLLGHRRAVIVDPEVPGSLNLATLVAAAEEVLVASPGLVQRYGLEIAADLRGLFSSHEAMLEFADQAIRPRLGVKAVAVLPTSEGAGSHRLRDLAIARGIYTVWLPGLEEASVRSSPVAAERYLRRLFSELPPLTPVFVERNVAHASVPSPAERLAVRYGLRAVHLDGAGSTSLWSRLEPREPGEAPAEGEAEGEAEGAAEGEAEGAAEGTAQADEAAPPPAAPAIGDRSSIYIAQVSAPISAAALARLADGGPAPPGDTSRPGSTLESGVADILRTQAGASRRGRSAPGLAVRASDLDGFGSAYGSRQEELLRTRIEALGEEMLRLGADHLGILDVEPGADPEWLSALAALPEGSAVVLHGTQTDDGALPDARVIGKTVVFRAMGASGLARLLDPATREGLRPLFPLFLAATSETVAQVLGQGPAPPPAPESADSAPQAAPPGPPSGVVIASPGAIAPFAREILSRQRIASELAIAGGSVWRYNDRGEDLGAHWRRRGFDDSTWKSGRARLGYGDGNEVTVIEFGPDSNAKYPTYYFRHEFTVEKPETVRLLALEYVVDDGLVIYLNGAEIHRHNVPDGEIAYTTEANQTVGGSAETAWNSAFGPSAELANGKNVIAVEVHQQGANSSDLGFDLRLSLLRATAVTGGEE